MRRGEILKASRQLKRRKKKARRVMGFLVLTFLLGGTVAVANLQYLNISDVKIREEKESAKTKMEKIARDNLEGFYFFIIPRANIFFYPKKAIEAALKKAYLDAETVEIKARGGGLLTIDIKKREPKYLWCQKDSCYYLDRDGMAFSRAPSFSGDAFLRIYKEASANFSINLLGLSIMSRGQFVSLTDFISKMPFKPVKLFVKRENYYELENGNGYIIIFSDNVPYDIAIENLITALGSEVIIKGLAEGMKLEYVDLRLKEKIFYKFKQ